MTGGIIASCVGFETRLRTERERSQIGESGEKKHSEIEKGVER